MTDFEQKLQSSFQTVFPGVDNSGCLFHFNQAVLRKVNLIGLKAAYEEKPINPVTGRRGTSATKKHIRRACALAFVPAQDVPAAWDEICLINLMHLSPTLREHGLEEGTPTLSTP